MLNLKHSDVIITSPHEVEMPDNLHDFRAAFDAAVESGDEVSMMAYRPILQAIEERVGVLDSEKEAAAQFIVSCQVLEALGAAPPRGHLLRALSVRYAGAFHRLTLSENSQWLPNN